MAALWHCPCDLRTDTQYAESTPAAVYRGSLTSPHVESYGVFAEAVDGNNIDAVTEPPGRVIGRTRVGGGPGFPPSARTTAIRDNTATRGLTGRRRSGGMAASRPAVQARGCRRPWIAEGELDELTRAPGEIEADRVGLRHDPSPISGLSRTSTGSGDVAAFGGVGR